MGGDAALIKVVAIGLVGLAVSVMVERCLQPRPQWVRPCGAWGAHVGLWCTVYGLLTLIMGRPWCAMTAVSALIVTLVLVNNAKLRSLRETFIFQDYDYFIDALLHPRLFLPFFGVKKFLLAAAFFVLALAGFLQETPPLRRFALTGQGGGVLLVLTLGGLLLWRAVLQRLPLCFDPEEDMQRLGLLPSLWAYAMAERQLPDKELSPLARMRGKARPHMPHLVAVQSESFFDARSLFAGIHPHVLGAFDALRAESHMYGDLSVPSWGANTVRTEFAFLSGIADASMGVHRFNPYRPVLRGWPVHSFPLLLKSLGYQTLCIHPYSAKFYGRNRALKSLGFDAFLDIKTFAGARRCGAYVADAEVGERIVEVLDKAQGPVFVFAITMENHGPLHLEQPCPQGVEQLYTSPPPEGCDELTIYLRHLRNADSMVSFLREKMDKAAYEAALCWYGDHVPIMTSAYKVLHAPDGKVPYVCWQNSAARSRHSGTQGGAPHSAPAMSQAQPLSAQPLSAENLGLRWLASLNLLQGL